MEKPSDALLNKPRALFLSPEAPYPLNGGGAFRSASLLHYLAQNYLVDVILFRQPGADDPAAALPYGLTKEVQVLELPSSARHTPGRIARNAGRLLRGVPPLLDRFSGFEDQIAWFVRSQRYHVSILEHFWCAPYWKQIAPRSDGIILDLHNIESVWHGRCAALENGPATLAHRSFQRAYRALEKEWLPRFTSILAPSEHDHALIQSIAPNTRVAVYPNAIPLARIPDQPAEHVVVFSGNLEYRPNIAAVQFFARSIWPRLRAQWPDLVWRLVGKNPEAVRNLVRGDGRVQLTGAVEDALPELARAEAAVVPLLSGSGTRIKILEAWAASVPVVSTRLGAEGLPVIHGENILLADSPVEFAEAVSKLLLSRGLRQEIARAARAVYEREFTWDAAWKKLNLSQALAGITQDHYTG